MDAKPYSPGGNIGTVAGQVWHYLNDHGAVTLSKLAREIEAPRPGYARRRLAGSRG